MRLFWFVPQGNQRVPADPETGYEGGVVSTISPLSQRQAQAVAARERRHARILTSLLEGMGFVARRGSAGWWEANAVGEGFNRFDAPPKNGYHYSTGVGLDFGGSGVVPDEMIERFALLPDEIVADARGRTVTFAETWGAAQVRLEQDADTGGILRANLRLTTPVYFYQWENFPSLWRIGRWFEPASKDQERRRKRLDEPQLAQLTRDWDVHQPLSGGLSKEEALLRVRFYLIGAQVDVTEAQFEGVRVVDAWQVSVTGVPGVESMRIGDDGVIELPPRTATSDVE